MSDWKETKEIVHEVCELFQRHDQVDDIQDVSKMTREIENYHNNSIKELKDHIKVLTTTLSNKEAQVSAPSEEEHAKLIRTYIDKKNELQLELTKLREDIDRKRSDIQLVLGNISNVNEQISQQKVNLDVKDSRTAYAMSLYSKISHITWNLASPDGRLIGYIENDKKAEITQFEMEKTSNQYEITNKLWELVGSAVSV